MTVRNALSKLGGALAVLALVLSILITGAMLVAAYVAFTH